jgi:hypothetical protein
MNFIRITAKYTWQGYKTQWRNFYQNSKFCQVWRKFKITEINGYNICGDWTATDRLPHLVMKCQLFLK